MKQNQTSMAALASDKMVKAMRRLEIVQKKLGRMSQFAARGQKRVSAMKLEKAILQRSAELSELYKDIWNASISMKEIPIILMGRQSYD